MYDNNIKLEWNTINLKSELLGTKIYIYIIKTLCLESQ